MMGLGKEIYQAKYKELYIPDGGQIYTTNADLGAGKRLRCATFITSADANVTYQMLGGDTVTTFPAKGGIPYPELVKKISVVSTGSIWLLHNGELEYSGRETAPTTQASAIQFSSVGATGMTVAFTNGSGRSRILVARSGGAVNSNPVNKTTYTGSLTFGSGSQIGTGNYVIGVGSGPFVVTGLTTATTYHFRVYEFRGEAGNETYNVATATGNPASQATS